MNLGRQFAICAASNQLNDLDQAKSTQQDSKHRPLGMTVKARSTFTKSPVSTDAPVPNATIYSKATREASSVHNGGCGKKVRAKTCTTTATIMNENTTQMIHLITRSIFCNSTGIAILHIVFASPPLVRGRHCSHGDGGDPNSDTTYISRRTSS